MISPDRARRLVRSRAIPLSTEIVPVERALGRVLAENVRARYAMPAFSNSAMDGYAVASRATRGASKRSPVRLKLVAPVYAGDVERRSLAADRACAITTGAAMPRGLDAVVPIEAARIEDGHLIVAHPVPSSLHVRRRGEELPTGSSVVRRGAWVHPGVVACIAAAGSRSVCVVRRPVVSVIATGDETVTPGRPLAHGQIYDSNSYMLESMLRRTGIDAVRVRRVRDRPAPLARAVADALAASDVVVVTGGVSVGERDLLRAELAKQRVAEVFWRVRQKPGKPLYFGTKAHTLVFGLPGNPASAFACFYVYVYPALRRMAGAEGFGPPIEERVLVGTVERDATRWLFLKGCSTSGPQGGVEVLPRQASHMVSSLAHTNRLIVVPPGDGVVRNGARVETYRLPVDGEDE